MKDFSKILSDWYLKNGRELPWRTTQNPYFIWLSEIILQQTRVEQGLPYYERFIENFPKIQDLAKASQDKVLLLWQGLGYYSRARNLHSAAKQIVAEYDGVFPNSYQAIHTLKGVGDYTSAAIASFAFGLPYSVVDGNVYRFLSRCFGIATPIDSSEGKKEFAQLAEKLLDKRNPGRHNQAMMEMGAIICKPTHPNCIECPFAGNCVAYNNELIPHLPVKAKKLKVRTRHFNYLIIHDGTSVVIAPRTAKDIWQGLFEFPLIETDYNIEPAELLFDDRFLSITNGKGTYASSSEQIKHLLSHQKLLARFYWISVKNFSLYKKYQVVRFEDLVHFGMPQLIVKYLKDHRIKSAKNLVK